MVMPLSGGLPRSPFPPTSFPANVTVTNSGGVAITMDNVTVTAPGNLITEQSYWAPENNTNLPAVPNLAGGTTDGTISAVATYNSIGVAWVTTKGSPVKPCTVTYTETGGSAIHALDLYWDDKVGEKEYRGSIVHLKENTEYTIRCKLVDDGDWYETITQTTWKLHPTENEINDLGTQTSTLFLNNTNSGTDINNWNVWENFTIDVSKGDDYCVKLDGCQYIILRNIIFLNAGIVGIWLQGGSKDIIIENCTIQGWGRPGTTNFVANFDGEGTDTGESKDAAIANEHQGGGKDKTITRITIRRNIINSPSYPTNAWDQPISSTHPEGPVGIRFSDTLGNHVIAYNEITSGNGNRYLDALQGGDNTSVEGFPGHDSDIFGNIISGVWDDAVQTEGGNKNVRVWGNYIDTTFTAWASVTVHFGPVYFWRNVIDKMNKFSAEVAAEGRIGKHSGTEGGFGGGPMVAFNNVSIQTGGVLEGIEKGFMGLSNPDTQHLITRNNFIYLIGNSHGIKVFGTEPDIDLDYDFTSGGFTSIPAGNELNGDTGVTPQFINDPLPYSPTAPTGDYKLVVATPGYNDGEYQPNFNANMQGTNPDIGAHEKGTSVMMYGVNAFT